MNSEGEENKNKIPYKMARLAWPKSKYGLILAVIIIIAVNLIYYRDTIFSFLKLKYGTLINVKKLIKISKTKRN